MQRDPSAVSLEKFVLNSLSTIAQETTGRGQAQKDVREAAIKLLEELGVAEFGKPGSRLSVPFPPDVTSQLLEVLRGALALGNPRLTEPALSCMHKLVAYAYLQGETGASGRLHDTDNVVTQVVSMTAKCGESNSAATQLQVVKALLTYVTAEHFLAHGDVLMQAVRAVFNTALGAESADIQNTARSALLQMVNTVLKRVGQQIVSPGGTPLPSPAPHAFRAPWSASSSSDNVAAAAAAAAAAERAGSATSSAAAAAAQAEGVVEDAGSGTGVSRMGSAADAADAQPLSPAQSAALQSALSEEMAVPAPAASGRCSPTAPGGGAGMQGEPAAALEPRGQPSADVAEAADVAALAADMAELQSMLPRIQTTPGTPVSPLSARDSGVGEVNGSARRASDLAGSGTTALSAERFVEAAVEADARTAQLATLAEASDLRGLERALDSLPQAEPSVGGPAAHRLNRQDTPPDPRRALMRDRRAAAWKLLTPVERDALIVLTAMSKMASRETGFGSVEGYLHQGKLLALDLLVRVLTNPTHDWGHMRPEFAAELRYPLCLVLLRNCSSPYEQALTAAVRLFEAILSAQKLRAGLKAELGALYPLLLLKPVEAAAPDSPHALLMAAEGILHVCSRPQVLVDLFVNYDCSLQAANLYERTIKCVRRLATLPDATPALPPATAQRLMELSLGALLAAIKSLDTWAGPIKSAAAAVALTPEDAAAASEGGEGGEGPAAAVPLDRQELRRILADKELKEALLSGIQAFNRDAVKGLRALVRTGVIPDPSPAAAARFLREHAPRLDKGQLGELLGHHEEHSVQVMHCYIDAERYGGLALDAALRRLLASFRLPGEAQKIDRIMEKFAERYCRDNPHAFGTADGAYLLAFAIIMLNTDAHNPMADRRISADDFVSMAQCQVDAPDGGPQFEQILPTEELLAIYRRITEDEIKVAGEEGEEASAAPSGSGRSRGGGDRRADGSRRARLAAAVGVSQMVLPFWSGATWDKQHGVDVERRRLLEFTRQMIASSGAVAGNIWHTATHAEHARPMMQVSGDSFLACLKAALDASPNMHQALQVLAAYEQAVRLAALLRLDALCEALVSGLAAAAGLGHPAPHSSAAEAKQVAALSRLVALGSCSEAGALGSAWLVLLRALSQLEALQARLLPGSKGGLPPLPQGAAAALASSSLDAAPPPPPQASSFGRLLQRMGLASGAAPEPARGGAGGPSGLAAIGDQPGAGHVMWAETAGVAAVERVFTNSAALHGDAVLSFARALCAVSQEELHPAAPGERPRVGLLQRVVECAYHNQGRIRLVWSRLWATVSQHLVSAACHTDAYVAMYAVDALRQLAAKLLDRAELARFTHQGEALRPFAAVLRHSDSPAVRELAVACVAHAASAHPRGLGSGWRSVLEALTQAARDPSPAVVGQALDALPPVIEALLRPAGHTQLRECVAAVLAGVGNPHGFEELSLAALQLFRALARRLGEALSDGEAGEALAALEHAAPAAGAAASPERAAQRLSPALGPAAAEQQQQQQAGEEEEAAAARPAPGGDSQPASPAGADAAVGAWRALLVPLATVARLDERPRVADAAAAVLMQVLAAHGGALAPLPWQLLLEATLLPLLALPAEEAAVGGTPRLDGAHPPTQRPASPEVAEVAAPADGGGADGEPPATARTASAQPAAALLPPAVPGTLSFEGLDRLERHASTHMPELWQLLLEADLAAAAAEAAAEAAQRQPGRANGGGEPAAGARAPARRLPLLWRPLLALLQRYVSFPAESTAVLGVNQLHQLLLAAAPLLDADCWQVAAAALQELCLRDPWAPDAAPGAAAAAAEALRRRSRLAVLLQRVLDSLLRQRAAAMPGQVQLQLLDLLHRTVLAAAAINAAPGRRDAAQRVLAAGPQGCAGGAPAAWPQGADGVNGGTDSTAAAGGQPGLLPEDSSGGGGGGGLPGGGEEEEEGGGAAAWEQLRPALARQEAEGGCLYIAALQRCVRAPAASNGTAAAVAAECEQRLALFCLWVVQGAAQRLAPSDDGAAGSGASSPDAAAAALAAAVAASPGAPPMASPADGAAPAPNPADQAWDDAVRAPVVDAALQAYCELSPPVWAVQQAAAFPHLARLVCSPSRSVRRALRALLQRHVPSLLAATA